MLTFLYQLRDLFLSGHLHYFTVFFVYVWGRWGLVALVARRYKPYTEPYFATTAVIVPVVDEPTEEFKQVLESIAMNNPTRVIVVINGQRNEAIEDVYRSVAQSRRGWLKRPVWSRRPGKRNAVTTGVLHKTARNCDVIVIADSDTRWEPNTLEELLKPFADSKIGGVTTHQNIYPERREQGIIARFADWMEDTRTLYSMPAMSVFGTVGCLPGRTIAIRSEVFFDDDGRNITRFMEEKFLGIFIEWSDDRTWTNYVLQMAEHHDEYHQTYYQRTSRVTTDAPLRLRTWIKQQMRWAQGSQYNTLRMSWFMLRHKRTRFLAFLYLTEIVTPFFWLGTLLHLAWKLGIGDTSDYLPGPLWAQLVLCGAGMLASARVRNHKHLRRYRQDNSFVYLVAYVVLLSFVLTPIRLWGFFRMSHDKGWATRKGAHAGTKQIHVLGIIPYILGTLMVTGFTVLGFWIEEPQVFFDTIAGHLTLIRTAGAGLICALTIITLGRLIKQARSEQQRSGLKISWGLTLGYAVGLKKAREEVEYRWWEAERLQIANKAPRGKRHRRYRPPTRPEDQDPKPDS